MNHKYVDSEHVNEMSRGNFYCSVQDPAFRNLNTFLIINLMSLACQSYMQNCLACPRCLSLFLELSVLT